jgi:hypothetical protein
VVTVRQFSRGVGRTVRALDREAARQQRQRQLHENASLRQAALDASHNAASTHERFVELLTGCHRVQFYRRDWEADANAMPPEDPPYNDVRERAAAAALAAYQPSWFTKATGGGDKQKVKLASAIASARREDEEAYRKACQKASERRDEIALSKAVLALKSDALLAAVNQHSKLSEVAVEGVNILAIDGRVIVVVDGLDLEDMPTQSVSLLQSGKASVKPLAASKVLEMHRDNICSSAVRVAVELLVVVPADAVEVVMQTDLLDRATGHIMSEPVLYVRVTAQALQSVNLKLAEPAMLAERLGAHYNWNRKSGFSPLNLGVFDLPLELLSDGTETT